MVFRKKGISSDDEEYLQEKGREKYIRRLAQLRTKMREAEATGDQEAIDKAKVAFRSHYRIADNLIEKAKAILKPDSNGMA